ncbi:MAG: class I SAM-dependent methyltransferase [Pseudonocardia sp.]|nr:class I SAM-dependent methyltransferase [Pseudonocardia sp.]
MTSLEIYNPRMTYNTAAVDYDTTSVDFWSYAATETVQRLGLSAGQSVLDVACGPGPAALAAADQVGPQGTVLGVDIAEEMIALARGHAAETGASQADFVVGSMDALDVGADRFDAATCVFGIFFASDVRASIAAMRDAVRPGGQVAVTSLGPKFFSPLYGQFIDAALAEHPGLDVDVPWHRTEDAEVMRAHLEAAGLEQVEVVHEVSALPLQTPEDWWRIATGTGIRRLIMDLEPSAAERVQEQNTAWIREQDIDHVELGVIYCRGIVAG